MAFDFPAAPAVDEDYTLGGIVYQWNGEAWQIKGGGDPQDYVQKIGDTMSGPLSFVDVTYKIEGGVNLLGHYVPAGAVHRFYVDGVEKGRIEGGANGFIGQGHVRAQGGGAFAFDRTADNQAGLYFYAAQIRSKGGGGEGVFEFWTDNGGWSSVACFNTTLGSGGGGVYVMGGLSAGSITDRGTAATKHDIRECIDDEVREAFAALKPKRFRKNLPEEKGEWPQPAPKLRFGFVVDDIVANPATKDIATMAYVAGTDGKEYEPEGTDIMQVLALAVAKIKLLEVEIDALKKRK